MIWTFVWEHLVKWVLLDLSALLTNSWTGLIGSGVRGSQIFSSDIFNGDNWPSMKQIFRTVFKRKVPLLSMREFKNNRKKFVVVYGACSHMG